MEHDKGVYAGLLDRNFADSERSLREATKRRERISGAEYERRLNVARRVERLTRLEQQVGGIDFIQQNRPLKPPGRL